MVVLAKRLEARRQPPSAQNLIGSFIRIRHPSQFKCSLSGGDRHRLLCAHVQMSGGPAPHRSWSKARASPSRVAAQSEQG